MAGEPEGMVSWLCGLCSRCLCCGYLCCCCPTTDKEKHPLLLGINGKPLPEDQEVQEMECRYSEPSTPGGGGTPWGSERHSEASEAPDLDDLEPVQKQPSSSQSVAAAAAGSHNGEHTSWKLVSSVPQEQQQFVIKIRKQTD